MHKPRPIAPANQGSISCTIEVADEHGITEAFSFESCDDDERATVGLCSRNAGTSEELAVDIAVALWQLTAEVTAAQTSHASLGTNTVAGS